jgi:hypothetical protein
MLKHPVPKFSIFLVMLNYISERAQETDAVG